MQSAYIFLATEIHIASGLFVHFPLALALALAVAVAVAVFSFYFCEDHAKSAMPILSPVYVYTQTHTHKSCVCLSSGVSRTYSSKCEQKLGIIIPVVACVQQLQNNAKFYT